MEKENNLSILSIMQMRFQLKNWKRSFALLWNSSPIHTTFWAIFLIIQGIIPGIIVYLTKLVVDSLSLAVNSQGEWNSIRTSLTYIGIIVGTMLLSEIIQSLLEMVRADQSDIVQDYVTKLVHDKSATLDMAHFESPEYHDRLEQATSGTTLPLSLLENLGGIVQNSITLLVMTALLVQYSVWIPLVLLAGALPAFLIVLWFDRKYHRWWRGTTAERRWIQYFDGILTFSLAAAEIKVFNLNPHFQSFYQKLRTKLRKEKMSQMRRLNTAKLFSTIFSLLILGVVLMWMGTRVLGGALTLGDLALFYQAFDRGQGLMRTFLGNVGQMIKNSLFLSVLFEFLDLKSKISDPENPVETPQNLESSIKINNITFRYPGTEKAIFEDFSLLIPAGKTIAIVGENGSGKTTLLKLLCRFYDPEKGNIEFDGIDIKNFAVKKLFRMITIMFQLPLSFNASVRETIAMGDLDEKVSNEEIINAAKSAGAHDFISRLPNGYDTLLGKAHASGVELSGGEWQRMALARAYIRKTAPLVLLDEPTSFLDSWAETHWFRLFKNLTKNRTAIVITHRFTIAMRADFIYVMNKGKIVESGTHQSLLELNGLYAQSWRDQMQAVKTAESNGNNSVHYDIFSQQTFFPNRLEK